MVKKINFYICLLLVSFIAQIIAAQKSISAKDIASSDIKLSVELPNKAVGEGREIEITVSLKNSLSENISFSYCRCDDFMGYHFEVFDAEKKLVEPTKSYSSKGFESWTLFEIMPEQEHQISLKLSDYYNLPKGNYSINVVLKISKSAKSERFFVKSSIVNLIISDTDLLKRQK